MPFHTLAASMFLRTASSRPSMDLCPDLSIPLVPEAMLRDIDFAMAAQEEGGSWGGGRVSG